MEYAIEINNLTKIYQKSSATPPKEALSAINLKIKKGAFFGLLGPNGAGKSTIINILAGLVKKTSGQVKIAGIDIDQDQKATKFKIGIVPQELIIDPFFNVYETLEIYSGYFGIPKAQRKTDEIIEALGLTSKAKAKPRSLSGGMRRRLLVAKALVQNPEILVLDEPTAGVDVELRNQLWQYVKNLNHNNGTTILLTTHYLEEAEELCNEIAVIDKGHLIACDKKENLMKLLSNKELVITTNGENSADLATKLPNLTIKNHNNKISITYDPEKIEVGAILKEITNLNINIKDIVTQQPDLEEIFKHLINKK